MPGKDTPRKPSSRPRPRPRDGFVAVGVVTAPRGTHGELKVFPLTDFPERFQPGSNLWAGDGRYTVVHSRTHRGAILVELDGIETRDEAEALRDLLLEVPESDLPPLEERQYFRFQIEGIDVFDTAGNRLGRVEEVLDTGANDVYIVLSPEGELLVPAIDSVVKSVDVDARRMVVELIAGLERRPVKPPTR